MHVPLPAGGRVEDFNATCAVRSAAGRHGLACALALTCFSSSAFAQSAAASTASEPPCRRRSAPICRRRSRTCHRRAASAEPQSPPSRDRRSHQRRVRRTRKAARRHARSPTSCANHSRAGKFDRILGSRKDRGAVEAFYGSREFAPLWIADGAMSERGKAAAAYLAGVDADGLDPADYPLPQIKAGAEPRRWPKPRSGSPTRC